MQAMNDPGERLAELREQRRKAIEMKESLHGTVRQEIQRIIEQIDAEIESLDKQPNPET